MSVSARKVIKRSSGCRPPASDRPLQMLVILLVLTGLLWVNSRPAQASYLNEDIPISVVDGISPPLTLEGDQHNPAIIALADKKLWLVVWEDWRNWGTTGVDIYGRFIDKNGAYYGDEIAICTQPGNQTVPTLAYRPTNTVLVAWQDTRGTTGGGYLYYRTLEVSNLAATAGGTFTLGDEIPMGYTSINGDKLVSRKLPRSDYDTTRNKFWLAWVESRDHTQQISERPFGNFGPDSLVSWQFGDADYLGYGTIDATNPASQDIDILRNSTGSEGTTVRLISSEQPEENKKVYTYEYFTNINNAVLACDRFSAETLIAWEGIRRKAVLTSTLDPGEDVDGDGHLDINEDQDGDGKLDTVNEDKNHNGTLDPGEDIDGDGNLDVNEDMDGDGKLDTVDEDTNHNGKLDTKKVTSELNLEDSWADDESTAHIFTLSDKHIFQANVNALRVDASAGAAHYPALAFEPVHRKFLVAWEKREENGFGKIYGQLLFSGGGSYGPNLLLSFQDLDGDGEQDASVAASNQTRPQVVADVADQLFFVTWQDGRNTQGTQENIDIYGQFVDCEGSLWGSNYPVTISPGNQYDPITSYNDGSHRFFTVWKDARNLYETNSDVYGRGFDIAEVQVFDFGRAATRIMINDSSSNTEITPVTVQFPTVTVGAAGMRGINLENLSASALTVQEVTVDGDAFTTGDLAAGDEIDAGAKHLFSVSFTPDHAGRFDGVLTIRLTGTSGPGTDGGTGTDTGGGLNSGAENLVERSCTIHLSGSARGEYIYYEEDSFTADQSYKLKMDTVTDAPGRLYVLLVHDPVSAGEIYAVLPDGTLTLFPYKTSSDWQSLYYTSGVPRAREVDLSAIDFRQLGCTSCQGPTLVDGYNFGDVPVQPPMAAAGTNAVDFKYLAGDLYIATYITNDTTSQPFNFNRGLVELLKLKINSLNGSWRVTSEYYGENRVHPALLQVQENDGNINAQWGSYHPVISYSATDSAYIINFTLSGYHYTYTINHLTANNFSGYYHCEYDGTVVVDQAPVSGIRVR